MRRPLPAVLLAVLLAGCGTSLPTPHGVQVGRPVTGDAAAEDLDLRKLPAGPADGATPEQIVQGWLAAATDVDVARQFLAPGTTWDPSAGATITADSPAVDRAGTADAGTTRVDVSGAVLGSLDASGSVQAADRSLLLSLTLTQDAGRWRITGLPPGVVVPAREARIGRCSVSLAWLTPDRSGAVRDEVLLPECDAGDRSAVADAAVRALLAGPPARLAGFVSGAVPAGTTLGGPVRVVRDGGGGSAVVDLATRATRLEGDVLALLHDEIALTLVDLTGVDRVRLLVDGQEVTTRPSGLVDPGQGAVEGGVGDPEAAALSVSPSGTRAARLHAVAGGTRPEVGTAKPGELPPTWGAAGPVAPDWQDLSLTATGDLWLVRGGRLLLVTDGQPHVVALPEGLRLRRLRVARDAVHAAAVTAAGAVLPLLVRGGAEPAVRVAAPAATGVTRVVATSSPDAVGEVVAAAAAQGRSGLWQVRLLPRVDDLVAGTAVVDALPAAPGCAPEQAARISTDPAGGTLLSCSTAGGQVLSLVRGGWQVVSGPGPRVHPGG